MTIVPNSMAKVEAEMRNNVEDLTTVFFMIADEWLALSHDCRANNIFLGLRNETKHPMFATAGHLYMPSRPSVKTGYCFTT